MDNRKFKEVEFENLSDKAEGAQQSIVITAKDETHANMVEALLNSYEIHVLREYRSIDECTSEIDIFVHNQDFETAKNILSMFMNKVEVEKDTVAKSSAYDGEFECDRTVKILIIMMALFIPGIFLLLYQLLGIFR